MAHALLHINQFDKQYLSVTQKSKKSAGSTDLHMYDNLLSRLVHFKIRWRREKALIFFLFLLKGIGRSTAKMLVECGAEVIALSRTQADLDSLKEEVRSHIAT